MTIDRRFPRKFATEKDALQHFREHRDEFQRAVEGWLNGGNQSVTRSGRDSASRPKPRPALKLPMSIQAEKYRHPGPVWPLQPAERRAELA
jgi:hypothetical protein